ncbi:Valine--tRNA ligase, partial [Haemophilus influenzae]
LLRMNMWIVNSVLVW